VYGLGYKVKFGFALLSLFYKIDKIPSFDIHYSTFDILLLYPCFDPPAPALTPET